MDPDAGRREFRVEAGKVVTVGSVKTHIGRLLAKRTARDRAQLVITAYETGLVTPERR
ncbi:hypothetical protein [Micromonospora sediminicola]|uniref:hypothetical protein n=1 Tax=Micromonospora sediminicola TaxID=946078 RepID=UPI00379FC2D7